MLNFNRIITITTVLMLLISLQALSESTGNANEISVVLVGDTMLAHKVAPIIKRKGVDYPYENVRAVLSQADIAVGNLEGPVATMGEPVPDKSFTFCSRPEVVKGMARAGFDVFALANNHSGDYGNEALLQTLEVLKQNGIKFCGAGKNITEARKPAIAKVKRSTVPDEKGKTFAFLSYSRTYPFEFFAEANKPGTANGLPGYFMRDIKKAKENADFVVVAFHWGGEYVQQPRDYQRNFAKKAIDAGADVVFGHHPHILQGIEIYQNKPIAYSLGNFVFGTYNPKAKRSVIMRVVFENNSVKRIELLPINVLNVEVQFQPRLLTGTEAKLVVDELGELSNEWGTKIKFVNGKGIINLQ